MERCWRDERRSILEGLPANSARLDRGADQGAWGTTWTIYLELGVPLPKRTAQTLAGKAVRRLKALAETGELATTSRNPAYRPDAGRGQRNVQEVTQ